MRPPDISSTWATWIARTAGTRWVAEETSVPRRMRVVSRASPARVVHASVGPGSGSPAPMRMKWSDRKNPSNPARSVARANASCSS